MWYPALGETVRAKRLLHVRLGRWEHWFRLRPDRRGQIMGKLTDELSGLVFEVQFSRRRERLTGGEISRV